MDEQIIQQLKELVADQKAFAAKASEDIKNIGSVSNETKSSLTAIDQRMIEFQTQLDAIDKRVQDKKLGSQERKTLGQELTEHADFLAAHEGIGMRKKPLYFEFNRSAFSRKDVLESSLGNATSGVINLTRLPMNYDLAKQALRIRDVMQVRTLTTGNAFDWAKQSTRTNVASPQVEGSAKSESTYNWTTDSAAIRTIAHYVDVSKQSLSDVPWLRGKIDSELIYGLKLKEEAEILSGDGTGVHLSGIITEATAYDTSTLSAALGWERLDILRRAKLQARVAGLASYPPSAFVLNPTDMAEIELTKDTTGRYIVGDPKTGMEVNYVWGLPVVESDSITAGTFLVGAFANAVELVERQGVSVEISFEHGNNFTYNMATILCEERIGIGIAVPGAFITGSFTTSPS